MIYFQWKVGDRCLAAWSKNNQLYEAKITEVCEPEKVYKVKYDKYDEMEKRSCMELCPMTDQHLSRDDQYHQNRQQGRRKPERHSQVVICIACCL